MPAICPGVQACGWHHTKQALRTRASVTGEEGSVPEAPEGDFYSEENSPDTGSPRITRLLHTPGTPLPAAPSHAQAPSSHQEEGVLAAQGKEARNPGAWEGEGKESKGNSIQG